MKKALITGITGMDGSHMADLLLSKDYEVYGLERHKSVPNRTNIKHIENKIHIIKGDLTDLSSLIHVLDEVRPDEVYNFAAQSFVQPSWTLSEMTCDVNGLGVLRLLEAIRLVDKNIRVLQASSSEMFGNNAERVLNETSRFLPRSPYGTAKVFGHNIVQNFRAAYGMYATASICFNHESERRGLHFVTRKISHNVAKIHLGLVDHIKLGNIKTYRDWGYSPDYCRGIWTMLQQETPDDFVFSTGEAHSIEEFIQEAFLLIGIEDWRNYIVFDPSVFRKSEVDHLLGDYSKAKEKLGWEPTVHFKELVLRMVNNDIKLLKEMSA